MRIFLARHGETDWNVERRIQGTTDIPLNENGMRQAHSLGSYLDRLFHAEGGSLSYIFTSPLIRAKETAEIVGRRLDVEVEAVPGLEEMNFGICEGKTWVEAKSLYPRELEEWEENKRYRRVSGGESYQDVLARFFFAYTLIQEKLTMAGKDSEKGDILIITHGAVIMLLLSLRDGYALSESFIRVRVENARAYSFTDEEIDAIRERL